jgi:hypothetical protein
MMFFSPIDCLSYLQNREVKNKTKQKQEQQQKEIQGAGVAIVLHI